MKPSFFSLFKKGRYSHHFYVDSRQDGESPEVVQKKREERERFAAAAIAFCFEHNEDFYRHFWQNICHTEGEPELPDSKPIIQIEPFPWADLLIQGQIGAKEFAIVIECKAGAVLYNHQNPAHDDFHNDQGYGFQMNAELNRDGSACLKYVVLGFPEELNLPSVHPRLPIQLSQKTWADLEEGAPSHRLIEDLLHSLGQIGVGEFWMKDIKNMKVTSGLQSVGQAWDVLTASIIKLKLGAQYSHSIEAGRTEKGSCLGAYILTKGASKGSSDMHVRLWEVTKSGSEYLAWFGYEVENGNTRRTIWLYCEDQRRAEWLRSKIQSDTVELVPKEVLGQACVVVADAGTGEESDVEWLCSRIQAIGALGNGVSPVLPS